MRTTFAGGEDPLSRAENTSWEQILFNEIVRGLGKPAVESDVLLTAMMQHPSVATGVYGPPSSLLGQYIGNSFQEKT